jgi:putative heme-binding domain-containing protein
MALARDPKGHSHNDILSRLVGLEFPQLTEQQKLMAVECYLLCLQSAYQPTPAQITEIETQLAPHFPESSERLNLKISQVLARLKSSSLVPKVMDWLPQTTDQSLRLHGLFLLRDAQAGWNPELRQNYFTAIKGMREFQGGEGLPTFIRRIEEDALATLDPALRPEFEEQLKRSNSDELAPTKPRPFVQAWKMEDLERDLFADSNQHNFERGKTMFREAMCIRCHRMGFDGASVGPDLTSLGRRFSRRDMLETILIPSKVVAEQYRLAKVQTKDGQILTGQIIPSPDYRSPELHVATKPLEPYKITKVSKSEIESFEISETSVMPNDLLNSFTKDEIRDLLAWLEAGGNPNHPNYRQ